MCNMCGVVPLRFVHVTTCIPQLPLNSLILKPALTNSGDLVSQAAWFPSQSLEPASSAQILSPLY